MSKVVNRRRFMQTSLATAAVFTVSAARGNSLAGDLDVEAVVIGSGFGGAVASLRLGEAGIETVVLERGLRWPITAAGDTFCTKENPDGRAAWLSSTRAPIIGEQYGIVYIAPAPEALDCSCER
jgi:cholesterol oxidase